ncbi:MAG: hypothetical protein D3923_08740, partial [Candidatus Electrothrix sp. AR3]|nr:hypothetical protein [Candidatus Electrothrix sp. AR3]
MKTTSKIFHKSFISLAFLFTAPLTAVMPKCVNHKKLLDKIPENFQILFESVATDLLTEQLDRKDILVHLANQTRQ